jgi:hypothetical protein
MLIPSPILNILTSVIDKILMVRTLKKSDGLSHFNSIFNPILYCVCFQEVDNTSLLNSF